MKSFLFLAIGIVEKFNEKLSNFTQKYFLENFIEKN